MKRNQNIVALSRDHHFGLLCSWKIKKGMQSKIDFQRIKNYIQHFESHHLRSHFEEEENILFPNSSEEIRKIIENDHAKIRELAESLNHNEDESIFLEFADLLTAHIRFEERVWFPALENTLSEDVWKEIGLALDKIHIAETDDYEDEFWR